MGTIKRGILGGFKNKVGSVIGSSWKGIDTMRSMPLSVANPKTTKQIKVRSYFKTLVVCASDVNASLIRPYWTRFAKMMTGANAFIRANYDNFANLTFDFTRGAILSRGKLDMVGAISAEFEDGETSISVSYDSVLGAYGALDDIVELWAVKATRTASASSLVIEKLAQSDRETGGIASNLTVAQQTNTAFYLTVRRADGTLVADTDTSIIDNLD